METAPELAEPDPEPHPEPTLKRKRVKGTFGTLSLVKKKKKWLVTFRSEGKAITKREFATKEQAVQAKTKYDFDQVVPYREKRGGTYATIGWVDKTKKWVVTLRKDNKAVHNQNYDTKKEADHAKEQYDFDMVVPCRVMNIRGTTYGNVRWNNDKQKWMVQFRKDGIFKGNRRFGTKEEAEHAKRGFEFEGIIPPSKSDSDKVRRAAVIEPEPLRYPWDSATPGVCWNKREQKWSAYYNDENGRQKGLGMFSEKNDAVSARAPYHRQAKGSSRWRGVTWSSTGRWLVHCKKKYIGAFQSGDEGEERAARAYNVEAKRIGLTKLNDVPDAAEISKHDRFFKKGEKNQLYE